jgi:nitrate reductase molybdenum cofactor assembly chaperone NarJ/NarW
MEEDRLVLKLSAHLLGYPDQAIFESEELTDVISTIEDQQIRHLFKKFMLYVQSLSHKELCEQYVKQFDFSDQTTLYLTYNIFGDNRERGLAFVKLKMEFAKAGYYLQDGELPDYFPLILEFASIADQSFVQKIYAIHKKGIDTLYKNLKEKNSTYLPLLDISLLSLERIAELNKKIKKDNVG